MNVRFYRCVEDLPRACGKPLWKYVFETLAECDWDQPTQKWILGRKDTGIIPEWLLKEAVAKWRRHHTIGDLKKDDEKLRYFDFRLALYRLNIPDKYRFNTLNTYYKDGKSLAGSGES